MACSATEEEETIKSERNIHVKLSIWEITVPGNNYLL